MKMESQEYTRKLAETLNNAKNAYIEKLFKDGKSKEEITKEVTNMGDILAELQLVRNIRHQIELK